MPHSKEPWTVEFSQGQWVINKEHLREDWGLTGIRVSVKYNGSGLEHGPHCLVSEETAEANARRIVACVNACAGISNESLNTLLELFEKHGCKYE